VLRSYTPGFINQAYSALQAFSGGALDLNAAANNALLTLFSDEFVHRYLEGGYARDQELGADATGLEITVASGYSPRGFMDFIGGLPPGQGFFAHHPPPSDRVASMKLTLGKTRVASMNSSAPGSPFSPFAQDTASLRWCRCTTSSPRRADGLSERRFSGLSRRRRCLRARRPPGGAIQAATASEASATPSRPRAC
jgi:hypothetical protein